MKKEKQLIICSNQQNQKKNRKNEKQKNQRKENKKRPPRPSVDKLKKKKTNNREDSGREETVLVYRCQCPCNVQSVTCKTKLKELTHLLNCRRLLKTVSCHHRSPSFVPPFIPPSAISRKRNPNFFESVRVRNPSRCFVKRSA